MSLTRKLASILVDPGVLHRSPLAKCAVAFSWMALSSSARLSCFRGRVTSAPTPSIVASSPEDSRAGAKRPFQFRTSRWGDAGFGPNLRSAKREHVVPLAIHTADIHSWWIREGGLASAAQFCGVENSLVFLVKLIGFVECSWHGRRNCGQT